MPMLARFGGAIFVAFAATMLVFWGMQTLIMGGGSVELPDPGERLQSFLMQQPDDDVQTKNRQPKKPPVAPKEPPQPDMVKPDIASSSSTNFDMGALDLSTDLALDAGLAGGGGDGQLMAVMTPRPQYPRRAQQRGIEGYVTVQFTVTTLGTVKDPIVLDSEPPGVFDKAAIDSVLKTKYRPQMVDGVAVEVPNQRRVVRFEMEK